MRNGVQSTYIYIHTYIQYEVRLWETKFNIASGQRSLALDNVVHTQGPQPVCRATGAVLHLDQSRFSNQASGENIIICIYVCIAASHTTRCIFQWHFHIRAFFRTATSDANQSVVALNSKQCSFAPTICSIFVSKTASNTRTISSPLHVHPVLFRTTVYACCAEKPLQFCDSCSSLALLCETVGPLEYRVGANR